MAWSIIAPGHHQWTIRDFSLDNAAAQLAGPQSASTWFADCSQCRDSDRYDSPASALDHLYAHHFQGLSPERSKWIFEDPLLVWIRKISPGPARALSENQIFPVVETMIDDLNDLKEAIKSVIDSIMLNNTWELTDLPEWCKPLRCKWILKRKMKSDGFIDKYNAHLVAKGF